MATITAYFLVGSAHPYHGGIIPTHSLELHENSRPTLVLRTLDESEQGSGVLWIPTVETMLEDALLLISLRALRVRSIFDVADPKLMLPEVELLRDISTSDLKALHARNREYAGRTKVVMAILDESTLKEQIPVLKHYRTEMEVCVSVFHRWFHPSKQQFVTKGSLDFVPEAHPGN